MLAAARWLRDLETGYWVDSKPSLRVPLDHLGKKPAQSFDWSAPLRVAAVVLGALVGLTLLSVVGTRKGRPSTPTPVRVVPPTLDERHVAQTTCPRCRWPLSPGARSCGACGLPLT